MYARDDILSQKIISHIVHSKFYINIWMLQGTIENCLEKKKNHKMRKKERKKLINIMPWEKEWIVILYLEI